MLIACALAVVLAIDDALQCSPLMPWCSTTMGFDGHETPSEFIVTGVDKNGTAPSLKPDDRIVGLRELSFSARWRLHDVYKGYGGIAGELWRYQVLRDTRKFGIGIVVRQIPAGWGDWTDWTEILAALWGILFVTLLMTRRPDLVEARLLSLLVLFMINVNDMTGTFVALPAIEFSFVFFGALTLWTVPMLCLTLYAARIAKPLNRTRTALTAFTILIISVYTLIMGIYWILRFYIGISATSWFEALIWTGSVSLFSSLLCVVCAAIVAKADERQRAIWVLAAVAPIWLYYALINVTGGWWAYITIDYIILTIATAWLPVALTYAVISRRCIDIGYVLNRALIYGLLSLVVLCVFVIVEWGLTTWVQNVSRSTSVVINIAVALALGVSVRYLHGRIENFVDRVFFRRRHENEAALRRFAREAPYITRSDVLFLRLEQIIERHAEASFARFLSGPELDDNDPAVLTMRASHEGVEVHRTETQLQGELAFPVIARGRFLGVLVCGEKLNGEAYTPDDRQALEAIAAAIGSALDTLRSPDRDGQGDILNLLLEIRDLLKTRSVDLTPTE